MIQLHHGDSAEILKTLPENSVDALITDPPAAISFMAKKWDDDKGGREHWISWLKTILQESFRVVKPGTHGLVWALPRTSHWTMTAIEDAGWEVKDVIAHHYGSGFPKGQDISKKMDNDVAAQWKGWNTQLKPATEFWILCQKPLSEKTIVKNVLEHGTGALNIDACRIPTNDSLNGGAYSEGKNSDGEWGTMHNYTGKEFVQPIGRYPANVVMSHSETCVFKGYKKIKGITGSANGNLIGNHGENHNTNVLSGSKGVIVEKGQKIGFTDENGMETVEDWECSESCPVKMMNSQTGRFPSNVLLSHADGCQFVGYEQVKTGIAVNENRDPEKSHNVYGDFNQMKGENKGYANQDGLETVAKWECVDGCPVKEMNTQSGILKSGTGAVKKSTSKGWQGNAYGKESRPIGTPNIEYGDEGGAARFYMNFPPFVYQAKPSKKEKNAGCGDNRHPTVKSVILMEYFAKLLCPKDGVILDPFMGSGSTGVAAKKLGFGFIGIEKEEEYFYTAEQRIKTAGEIDK